MTISLNNSIFRGARRIRLLFSGPLASSAFTSLSYYAVASADNTGPSPISVEAVFAIASDPNAVELAIPVDFTPGGLFLFTCTALPAADSSFFTGSIENRVGQPVVAPPNVEPETSDYAAVLYGIDLAWNGGLQEDTTGDLMQISGRPNWQGAMQRRMISGGLTWDALYGANAEQAIDAPDAFAPALAGQFLAQARQDNRTNQATISFSQNPADVNGFTFAMQITGRDGLDPIVVTPPLPSTGG